LPIEHDKIEHRQSAIQPLDAGMSSEPTAKGGRKTIRIGKYEVLAHIATGGMGAVYKGIDTDLHREVALKVLTAETAAVPAALARFQREARHAAKLRHENIVTIYEFGESNGTWFLALEYVDGINLFEYISRKGQLDPEEARRITIHAALALHHAHGQGIIHRDIKPSNFLVTRKHGQLLIKLADFGLAREVRDDESRVTRMGSTVGTVDYISPEQARDSGAADIRSDIYSLGCTLYHMLAGRAPFSEGTVTERLYKHVKEEPPDLRQLNPRVPESMLAVLRHMLAKEPADRYQTPAALLKDLLALDTTVRPNTDRDVLAGLAFSGEELADSDAETALREVERRGPIHQAQSRPEPDESDHDGPPDTHSSEGPRTPIRLPAVEERKRSVVEARLPEAGAAGARAAARSGPPPNRRLALVWGIAGVLIALVIGGAAVALLSEGDGHRDDKRRATGPGSGDNTRDKAADSDPKGVQSPAKDGKPDKKSDKPIKKPSWPALYKPSAAIDWNKLRLEYQGPWTAPPKVPANAPIYYVSRLYATNPPTELAKSGSTFNTLAAAVAAAPADKVTIIEIQDNGPLFEAPAAVTGRSLLVRAAEGYHPLLVWDLEKTTIVKGEDEPLAFLAVKRGDLMFGGIDAVVQWPDAHSAPPCLLRVTDGDVLAWNSSFSVAGQHKAGITLVRFDGAGSKANKCRFSNCFARGTSLVALDSRPPNAEVMLDKCLFTCGEGPLLRIIGHKDAPSTLRVIRSTLVAEQSLLELKCGGAKGADPGLHWLGWDALLVRANTQSGGVLVSLPAKTDASAMTWRAVNCLQAGWKTLISGSEPIAATNAEAWRRRWRLPEGDVTLADPWRGAARNELAEVPPYVYDTQKTPFAFAATYGTGLLGCDLQAYDRLLLPLGRDTWLTVTYQRFVVPPIVKPGDKAPDIPKGTDGKYHGDRLNLNEVDLGAHLRAVRKKQPFAPVVVMHLHGTGECKTSMIRVKDARLILYFEPPKANEAPLVLVPDCKVAPKQDAFIEVENGDLDIAGADIRCPDYGSALLPHYLMFVRGGDLRVHSCRLQGPLLQPPDNYWGLVRVEGSGLSNPEWARDGAFTDSTLLSSRIAVHIFGAGARVRLQGCLIAGDGDALHFQPGTQTPDHLNVQCLLDHNTVATRRSVVYLEDAPNLMLPGEPIIVQTKANVFLNPFAAAKGKSTPPTGVLLYEGNALARGVLAWQGEGDVFDKRLRHYAMLAGQEATLERPQPRGTWTRLWGPLADRQPILNVPFKQTIDLEKLQLERLALPSTSKFKDPPGADLKRLGIVKNSGPKP
jgi:serine/threonine-protein kinase